MAEYKSGQFVKVQNKKGLYRARIAKDEFPCYFCALDETDDCGIHFPLCDLKISRKGYLEKVK